MFSLLFPFTEKKTFINISKKVRGKGQESTIKKSFEKSTTKKK